MASDFSLPPTSDRAVFARKGELKGTFAVRVFEDDTYYLVLHMNSPRLVLTAFTDTTPKQYRIHTLKNLHSPILEILSLVRTSTYRRSGRILLKAYSAFSISLNRFDFKDIP